MLMLTYSFLLFSSSHVAITIPHRVNMSLSTTISSGPSSSSTTTAQFHGGEKFARVRSLLEADQAAARGWADDRKFVDSDLYKHLYLQFDAQVIVDVMIVEEMVVVVIGV